MNERSKRMSDLISRQAAINAMESINDSICEQQAIDALCELPSAQPEIIRCKDCKYWQPHTQCGFDEDNDEYHNYCGYHMPGDEWYAEYWEADDYCSYGERKDNE